MQHILILLLVSLPLAAQVPNWYLPASRKMHYPLDTWCIGYVEGELHNEEKIDDAMSRLKNAARVDLVNSLITSVKSVSRNSAQSDLMQNTTYFEEQIREYFLVETEVTSSVKEAFGLMAEAYYDEKKGIIAAFACINKVNACSIYIGRQERIVEEVNSAIIIVDYLMSQNNYLKAKDELEKANEKFIQMDEFFKWLMIFECDETHVKQLLNQYTQLKMSTEQKASELSCNTMNIYMQCCSESSNISCSTIIDIIKGRLSGAQCSFVDTPLQADWRITIKAQEIIEDKRKNNPDFQFVTIALSGDLYCVKKQKKYSVCKSEREGAAITNGGAQLATNLIINRGSLVDAMTINIIEILKTK